MKWHNLPPTAIVPFRGVATQIAATVYPNVPLLEPVPVPPIVIQGAWSWQSGAAASASSCPCPDHRYPQTIARLDWRYT